MNQEIHCQYLLDEFTLDPGQRRLCRAGAPIRLAKRPFDVLLYLIAHRDRLVSRAELLELFWEGQDVYDDSARKAVGAVRKALGDQQAQPRFIEARYGGSYQYIGPLEELPANGAAELEVERTRGVKIVIEEELHDTGALVLAAAPAAPLAASQPRRLSPVFTRAAVLTLILLVSGAYVFYRGQARAPKTLPAPLRSIAVLPLKNLSGDPQQEFFSDGLSESFITELSRIAGLKVAARGSSFVFKGREVDPREVGSRLGVAAVLEGSVRRSGDRLRVEVRLTSTVDGRVLWTGDSYERTLGDVFSVERELACDVAERLRARLCGANEAPATRYTQSVAAYQAYLRGRYFINHQYDAPGPETALKQAAAQFEQASAIDPRYAPAYAGLADACTQLIWFAGEPRALIATAKTAARQAVELDETLAEAHLALGSALLHDWDFAGAARAFERAVALNPGNAWVQHEYSTYLNTVGRYAEWEEAARRSEELDPLNAVMIADRGNGLISGGRCDEARAQFRKAAALVPAIGANGGIMWQCLARQGRYAEAIREGRAALNAEGPTPWTLAALGVLYAAAGQPAEAERQLNELTELSKRQYVPKTCFAYLYAALGQHEQAFALLETAYREHDTQLLTIKGLAWPNKLRGDPRFVALVRRIGLPD